MSIPQVGLRGDSSASPDETDAATRDDPHRPSVHAATTTTQSPNPYVVSNLGEDQLSRMAPHRGASVLAFGVASLVTGLLGCGCCVLLFPFGIGLGVAAVITGNSDLKAMQAGLIDPSGYGTTQGGVVCGWIGIALSILRVLLTVVSLAMQFGFGG